MRGAGGGNSGPYNRGGQQYPPLRQGALPQNHQPATSSTYQGTNLSKDEFFRKQDEIPVEVSPPQADLELLSDFQNLPRSWNLNPKLVGNIPREYRKPTPVQKYAIPLILKHKDVVASAQTGSGKTCAFLFPSIHFVLSGQAGYRDSMFNNMPAPKVLVMAPTRELCQQIHEEAQKFCRNTGICLACVYGGVEYRESTAAVRNGSDIIIGTPGRLDDMIERKHLTMAKINTLILDEADRMLDVGFEPQIRKIVQKSGMNRNRQTVMTSATFPEGVQFLAQDFLKDYIFIAVGQVGAAATTIKQKVVWVDDDDKDSFLYGILLHLRQIGSALVFVNTKVTATDLERFLGKMGIRTVSIHGDKTQPQREASLADFKNKISPVMIATDVAARGLDIPDVALVVQYDCAMSSDDFVHRIGRTGRIGNKGMAITFMNNRNKGNAHEILEKLEKSGNAVPNWLKGMAISTGNFGGNAASGQGNAGGNTYGGQDFRKHTTGGFRTAQEREDAKKFAAFDQNAYGEGDANKAQSAAREIAKAGVSFEHMASGGKNKGGGKGGKGKGGGGKGGGRW
ncbi:unnamed protein product [Amoebophrya sp. A120]|nr:unnamed protein product [Amoebophrya sp. A120]|eukprot:GSA120T00003495001.1